MSLPRFFYAPPKMVRRWDRGTRFPGVYFVAPSGRARIVMPLGRPVESVYGPTR